MNFEPSVGVSLQLIQYYHNSKSAVSSQNASERTTEGEYNPALFFEDETAAYRHMYLFAQVNDTEYGALITKKGLIVNQYGTGGTDDIWQGRNHVIILGKQHYITWGGKLTRIYGHIHVHQDPDANYFSYVAEGGNDRNTQLNTKNMLFFLMCTDENKSFYSTTASNKEEGVFIQPLRGLGGYTVTSLLNGTLKLIPYSINYKYTK